MLMTRTQLLDGLVALIQTMPRDRPLRLGIDGRSAAGKTTIAEELADRLRSYGRTCIRASIDDFHPPGYKRRAIAGEFTPEVYLREGYDYAAFRRLLLEPLSPGGTRRCRVKFWNSNDDVPFREEWLEVADDAVLIVDGVFLLIPSLRSLWDFTIWLDVAWTTMLERASLRDVAWIGSVELVRQRYMTGWIPRHQWYEETIGPRELVDIVVDNSDATCPQVVAARAHASGWVQA